MTEITIPDEDVLYHVAYDASGDIPFGWHVFVLKDLDALKRVREQSLSNPSDDHERLAYAWTTMRNEPDGGNYIGEMYFAAGWVYVGMVAHEAMHMASWMCRFTEDRRRMSFGNEPERMAEMVGTLTSVVWYNLLSDEMVTEDE